MVRQKDIAEAIGVTRSIVSAVLNNHTGTMRISDKKRKLVLETARKMGYKVDDIARSIKTGRANTIGFISSMPPRVTSATEILLGMQEITSPADYFIKAISSSFDGNGAVLADTCIQQRFSGVVFHSMGGSCLTAAAEKLQEKNIPVLIVSNSYVPESCIHVDSNDDIGIEQSVKHLYDLRHRRIAYATTDIKFPFAKRRYKAFLSAMDKYYLKLPEKYLFAREDLTYCAFRKFAIELTQMSPAPTAICFGGDNLVFAVSGFLLENNIKIPRDLSLVGFGNSHLGGISYPSITTVDEPFFEMGKVSAETLLQKIAGKAVPMKISLDTKLIKRASSGEAPVKSK